MKLSRIFKIFTAPVNRLHAQLDHEGYARKIGVHAGKDLHIYGDSYKMFSTNPWLVRLGDNVHITDGCLFITHDGGTLAFRHLIPDLEITKPITVGDNVYIGVRTIIMPGVNIGSNVVIGSGSIVTHDIPNNSVAVGVPARVIKSSNDYLKKISSESLHFGTMNGKDKDVALRLYYESFKTK